MAEPLTFLTIDGTGDNHGHIYLDTAEMVDLREYECLRDGDACTMHYVETVRGRRISVYIPFTVCKITVDIEKNGIRVQQPAFSFRGIADMMLFCFAFRAARKPVVYNWKRRLDELGLFNYFGMMEAIERNMDGFISTCESLPWPEACVDPVTMMKRQYRHQAFAGEGW
ncbi:MAG: hypothetical protein LPL29_14435 [Alphaproteobacteria bacterium]|nr:hypothetical protein [Alphaproteobacteria bacterium]